jgi:hypothetical protein
VSARFFTSTALFLEEPREIRDEIVDPGRLAIPLERALGAQRVDAR